MYANIVDAKNDFGAHTQCKILENTRFQEPKNWIFFKEKYAFPESRSSRKPISVAPFTSP